MTEGLISLEKKMTRIDKDLEMLPEIKERILRLRFFEGLRWRDVAKMVNYSESYCKAIVKSDY